MIHLLRTTTRAINDLLDSSTTPHVRIILKKDRLLVQGLFTSFLFKEKVWLKSVPFMSARKGVMIQRIADTIFVSKKGLWLEWFLKNGQFSINVLKGINQGDFRVSLFWDLYFWSLKKFGRFEAIASLYVYQITKYQTLQNSFFLLIDFWRIRERASESEILSFIAKTGMIKEFIWFFQNRAPRGTKVFLFKWFYSERKCLSRWTDY